MTTHLLFALLVALVTAASIAALFLATRGAVDGYEDEFQFHHGVPSQPTAAASARPNQPAEEPRFKRRPQLIPTETGAAQIAGIGRLQRRR